MSAVWMMVAGSPGKVDVLRVDYERYRKELRERDPFGRSGTDDRIKALVEVGVIPYRERYQVRHDTDTRPTFEPMPIKGQPDYSALSEQCRVRFPKIMEYLHSSEQQD